MNKFIKTIVMGFCLFVGISHTSLEARCHISIGFGASFFTPRPAPCRPIYYPVRPGPRVIIEREIPSYTVHERVIVTRGPSPYSRVIASDRGYASHSERVEIYNTEDHTTPIKQNYKAEILEVYENGGVIQLNDGSLWQISERFKPLTSKWTRYSQVKIYQTKNQNYKLTNTHTKESVTAILKTAPTPR